MVIAKLSGATMSFLHFLANTSINILSAWQKMIKNRTEQIAMLNIKKIKVSADFEQISCLFGLEQSCCSRMHKRKKTNKSHTYTHMNLFYVFIIFCCYF